ncbi:cupin domain-containing protein [Actinomadura madurae]|uniref:cupin domain-containing protein n=1 Tax=Actinomadura madurae TaxID=1993 RepID=UPI0020D20DDA|nr:cupin domain-containing protein [Actinomadura madurae]MCQ0005682.1 cupin domain-containing protein [Actinomadura madurae]
MASIDTGTSLSVGAVTVVIGASDWTDGSLNVMDQIVPPGLIVAPHSHEKEHQATYVVRGTLGFWVDGEEFEIGAGGYIHRPAGKVHTLWNATGEPPRCWRSPLRAGGSRPTCGPSATSTTRGPPTWSR